MTTATHEWIAPPTLAHDAMDAFLDVLNAQQERTESGG
jgi:hypothetical protein